MIAVNFEEYVLAMAEEAPHAVILDWYRRLELMIRDYVRSRGVGFCGGPEAERVIASDSLPGADISNAIAALRNVRNAVAHEAAMVSSEEAYVFARQALDLIGFLWQARDIHAA